MAFHFSTFKVRAISAFFFVVIMLAGLTFNAWSFFILFLAIQLGCLVEFQKLMGKIVPSYENVSLLHKWGLLVLGSVIMTTLGPDDIGFQQYNFKNLAFKLLPFVFVIFLLADVFAKKVNLRNLAISFLGLIYISLSLSLFFQFRQIFLNSFFSNLAFMIPLLVIITIWVNDTMAYLVGSFIGKTKISSISPNKTWEGTIAGVFLSVLLVTKLVGMYIPIQEKYIFYIAIVAAIAGNFGDLFESKLKRLAGVKDSGSMMPGHGGFLDRFDSILLAAPFVWILLQFIF